MRLFLKIFLWFLAAVALMVAVIIFITRTFQTEPAFSRWQRSARNQLLFYRTTAEQIDAMGGDAALAKFADSLSQNGSISDVAVIRGDGVAEVGEALPAYNVVLDRTRASGDAEIDVNGTDPAVGAIPIMRRDGAKDILAIRWDPPRSPSIFFDSWVGILRLIGLLASALLVCYLLAAYLTSPIRKLRQATQRLARGELDSRVPPRLTRRRDELADLGRDFDVMAERIESLITSQQRLSRDVSHELRSPLARMNVALEIAKQRSTPEMAPSLQRIETESVRLNEMISRILTLAKLESGAADDLEKTRIDLTEVVRDVTSDADFEARGKGKSVELVRADAVTVSGNQNLLRSAVENVVRNAVKYTDEGTSVVVSLEASNGSARIRIADHGSGVPEAELEHLFRPFYRIAEARDRKSGGTGLGLAIAKRAIVAHKGQIGARNLDPGLEVEITLDRIEKK